MSFKVFIYYCALCGGWAAFLAWGISQVLDMYTWAPLPRSAGVGAVLGFLVAAAVGLMDALLNAVGAVRLVRVLICAGLGMAGGAFSGFLGGVLVDQLG